MDTLSLILVMGSAGSGKTTFAQRLAPKLGCVYLSTDLISNVAFPGDRDSPAYMKARPGIYGAIYNIAFANLRLGNSVLVDAPHVAQIGDPEWRTWVAGEAARSGARLCSIRCLCDIETVRSRIAARGEQRDIDKLANWSEFVRSEAVRDAIPLPHIDIDTGQDLDRNLALAMQYLSAA
jgi:predicted kinase